MKLKFLSPISMDKVPDHLIEEINQLAVKMGEALFPLFNHQNPNITMAAMNYVHAALINQLITDDPVEKVKAAKLTALALMRNIQRIAEIKDEDMFE